MENPCSYLNGSYENNLYDMGNAYSLSKKNRMWPWNFIMIIVMYKINSKMDKDLKGTKIKEKLAFYVGEIVGEICTLISISLL